MPQRSASFRPHNEDLVIVSRKASAHDIAMLHDMLGAAECEEAHLLALVLKESSFVSLIVAEPLQLPARDALAFD